MQCILELGGDLPTGEWMAYQVIDRPFSGSETESLLDWPENVLTFQMSNYTRFVELVLLVQFYIVERLGNRGDQAPRFILLSGTVS